MDREGEDCVGIVLRPAARTVFREEKGIALLVVLWGMVVVALLVGAFTTMMKLEIGVARNHRDARQALQLAKVGVGEAVLHLYADDNGYDTPEDSWASPIYGEVPGSGGSFGATVEDEGSRININTAPAAILRELPGVDEDEVASILDWRDVDEEPREFGAESSYYQGLDDPYNSKNGLFDTEKQVRLVKGMDEVYSEIEPYVTVWGKVNVNAASLESFDALLVSLGVDTFAAMDISNALGAYRTGKVRAFENLQNLPEVIPALSDEVFKAVSPHLTVDGEININFVDDNTLGVLFVALGFEESIFEQLISARNTRFFRNINELVGFGFKEKDFAIVRNYFSTTSSYFRIRSTGKITASGTERTLEVIVRRYRRPQDEGSQGSGKGDGESMWEIDIVSWEEV